MPILAEYADQVSAGSLEIVKKMLTLTSGGDLYSLESVDGDVLYLYYANPWLMGTILLARIGYLKIDTNTTNAANDFVNTAYELYSNYKSLAEFNLPPYAAVDLVALGLWIGFGPRGTNLIPSTLKTLLHLFWTLL